MDMLLREYGKMIADVVVIIAMLSIVVSLVNSSDGPFHYVVLEFVKNVYGGF